MFTDLDEFLDENLGFKSREYEVMIAESKRYAHGKAFFAAFEHWRKTCPVEFRLWSKARYARKKKDPIWWANRQKRNKAYKQKMRNDEHYKELRRQASLRSYHKRKNMPGFKEKRTAARRKLRATKRQAQLTLKFKKAA